MTARVETALRALRMVAERPDPTEPIGVGRLAELLGASLSPTSRLCSELERLGLLERAGPYGSYRLGAAAVRLSGRAAAPYARTVRSALTLAAQQTGETACLGAGAPQDMRFVASVASAWTLHSPADIGAPVDAGRSALVLAAEGNAGGAGNAGGTESADGLRVSESVVDKTMEFAAPVLTPDGRCAAVIAVRLPVIRASQAARRVRRAVDTARRSIERAIDQRVPAPRPAAPAPSAPATSIEAALRILQHLAEGDDTVAGAARAVGLRADRTQRLLGSCRRAGVVAASADRSGYGIDWLVHGWHRAASTGILTTGGAALVAAAAERFGTCSFITVLRGMRSFTLVEVLVSAGEGLEMMPWIGRAHPVIGSDGGPTLVLDFSPDELPALLPVRQTDDERATLVQRRAVVERDGVIATESFEEAGLLSLSAPIRDSSGSVAAAACIVGPKDTLRPRLPELRGAVLQLAERVSSLLA